MAYSEKTRIWLLIKKSLPELKRAGINPIEFLVWTQRKNIREVSNRIQSIESTSTSEGSGIDSENNSKLFPDKSKKEEDEDLNFGEFVEFPQEFLKTLFWRGFFRGQVALRGSVASHWQVAPHEHI